MRALALSLAFALTAFGAAQAQTGASSATLQGAPRQASVIIDGATWSCEGQTCTARGGKSQPASRACKRVASRLGPVTAFTFQGKALDEAQIAACNA